MTETDQPLVPPPVIETKSRWHDPITINAIWFAISTRSNILTPLLLPLLVQNFVGEASKGGAYGNLRLVSLMIALLFQALAGMLSDRNTSKFGRRRPIILIAAILDMLTYIAIGVIATPPASAQEVADALVAAGSVVTKDVPARTIVVGSPAKVLRPVPEEQLIENQIFFDK